MKKRGLEKHYKKISFIFAVSLVLSILTTLSFKISIFKQLELKTVDYRFRKSGRYSKKNNSDIVIVSIDDNSLKYFSKNGISWPWPRGRSRSFRRMGMEFEPRIVAFCCNW